MERKRTVYSCKRFCARVILLVSLLTIVRETHAVNEKLFSVAEAKNGQTARKVNEADSSAASSAASLPSVTYFDSKRVAATFSKGETLLDWKDGEGKYLVLISRHDKGDVAQIHNDHTHIFYVLQGTATFVTGGRLVDPKDIAPNEVRGASIEGGETRRLSKGDVVVIPHGVPHWWKEIDRSPFIFVAVNVR